MGLGSGPLGKGGWDGAGQRCIGERRVLRSGCQARCQVLGRAELGQDVEHWAPVGGMGGGGHGEGDWEAS